MQGGPSNAGFVCVEINMQGGPSNARFVCIEVNSNAGSVCFCSVDAYRVVVLDLEVWLWVFRLQCDKQCIHRKARHGYDITCRSSNKAQSGGVYGTLCMLARVRCVRLRGVHIFCGFWGSHIFT